MGMLISQLFKIEENPTFGKAPIGGISITTYENGIKTVETYNGSRLISTVSTIISDQTSNKAGSIESPLPSPSDPDATVTKTFNNKDKDKELVDETLLLTNSSSNST